MALVLLNERQFVLAESILDISVSENYDYSSHRRKTLLGEESDLEEAPVMNYNVVIEYVPMGWGAQGHCSSRTHIITVKDEALAIKLFKALVEQYRDQNPDEMYLQKIIEGFLGGNNDGSTT